jgi:hypothetical protein
MTSTLKRTSGLCVLALFLLVGTSGCLKSGKITGKVTYDGKPVTVGIVSFHPDKGKAVETEIAEDGTFTLEKVPAGPGTFTVSTSAQAKERKNLRQGMQMPGGGKGPPGGMAKELEEMQEENKKRLARLEKMVEVPEKYSKKEESGQTYTATSGEQEHNIDLPKK